MLDSLDTLIAFVLIMLVVSLLITIVVQICAVAKQYDAPQPRFSNVILD